MRNIASILSFIGALALAGSALAECDYRFSGRILLEHNNVIRPLHGVKVRVKRENGTGAGRNFVRTDKNGRFDGAWRFDRDQNGKLPGANDINFAVQLQLDGGDRLRVVKGGWTNPPWDTFATSTGKNCQQFILPDKVFSFDHGITPDDADNRAYIYLVANKLLRALDAKGVGLKSGIIYVYPEKNIFSEDKSFFMTRVNIDTPDWDNVRTIIHETMHQWDVNWMKGEASFLCVGDAHHKPPSNWRSARCSGFMEGFAEAMARALFNDIFASDPFFNEGGTFGGPESHADLRNDNDSSGSIQNLDQAERNDDGWRNFLQFFMWPDKWRAFNPDKDGNDTGIFNFPQCEPIDVPVYGLLTALKEEAPNHGESKATFRWFTVIMQRRVSGFSARDARFYELLGDPSVEPVAMQEELCPNELAAARALTAPLKRPNKDTIKKAFPRIKNN